MPTLTPISPLEYITPRDPIPESVLDVSAWYKTETLELTFGEYVGRPSEFVDLHKSDLVYYLGNGWYVDAVLSRGSGGQWQSVSGASVSTGGTSSSENEANAAATSFSASADGEEQISQRATVETDKKTITVGINVPKGLAASSGITTGTSNSNASARNSATSLSESTQSGGPYWAAWSKIRLKRRRMQSEAVLKDMISSFTTAYNEGREINNERYQELVSLYAIMLSRTEDEANGLSFQVEDFKPLADMVIKAVRDALDKFGGSVSKIPDEWMKSRIAEINRKFDALIGTTRTEMVSKGTYNSTVWPTTQAGIERQRQYALNDLKDEMVTARIDAYGKIASITADIGRKLLDCEIAIIEAQNKFLLGPTEIRNTVFKWMLDFMERRDDDYPGLEQLVTVADRLGYADGGMAAPTS